MSKILKILTSIITINVYLLRLLGLPPFVYDNTKKIFKSSKTRTIYAILFLCFFNIYLFHISRVITVKNIIKRIYVELAANVTSFFMIFGHISILTIHLYHLMYSDVFLLLLNQTCSIFKQIHKKLLVFEGLTELSDFKMQLKEIYIVNIVMNTMSVVFCVDAVIVLTLISDAEIIPTIMGIASFFQISMINFIINFLVSYQSILLYYYKKINYHLENTIKRLNTIEGLGLRKHVLGHLDVSDAIDELAILHKDVSNCTKMFVDFFTLHISAALFESFMYSTLGVSYILFNGVKNSS